MKDPTIGLTAFIDILGFGDIVVAAETPQDVSNITTQIRRVQQEFEYATTDPSLKQIHEMYGKTVLAFSDSVLVHIPLQSDFTRHEGTFDPIMSELTSFAWAQGGCVLRDIFLRGGIEIGWWHHDGSTLVSQSLVGAYRLEQRACMPVIALTSKLYTLLAEHPHRGFYSERIDPIRNTFRKCDGVPGRLDSEFWYLDYISICIESLGWERSDLQRAEYRIARGEDRDKILNDGYRENVKDWLTLHGRAVKAAYEEANLEKVKAKYKWLAHYHNEVATGKGLDSTAITLV
jgi:hypothetical protein